MYSAKRRDWINRYNVPVLNCEVVITISICGTFQATINSSNQVEYRPAQTALKNLSNEDSEFLFFSIESTK